MFLPFFQSDWWVCMPEPLSWKSGFGMNVAVLPHFRAVFLAQYLYHMTLSAILVSVSKRSEEHTSELQSQSNLVCRLLLEKKKFELVEEDLLGATIIDYKTGEVLKQGIADGRTARSLQVQIYALAWCSSTYAIRQRLELSF